MNHGNSFIIGCAPFGLDDHVISADGAINKNCGFFPASVLLPGRSYGPILCGDQARAARTHSGLPWPPEAWIKKGEHLRRAPVSLVWRALVEARDNQARWDIGGGVSFPLAKILAAHIVDLLQPLSVTDASLRLTILIPNDLDEYGQENLLSELGRVLPEKEVRLLWRPVAAALTWLDAAGDGMISVVKPNDFILVLYLGPDAIECVPFQLRIRRHNKNDYIVPLRDRPTAISPLAGYDWIGGMIEQLSQVRKGGNGSLWQAFTSFPESWGILAGKDLQCDELPRVWGGDGNYGLWHPDQQELKGIFNRIPCGPSNQIQAMLQSSCTLLGSRSSGLSWPQRLTALVKETVNKQTEGRLAGLIVCGSLAPSSPPDWLTECFPILESRGLTSSGPWNSCMPNRLWMSSGNEAIAQGAALFNFRLINDEPTYLDTLPQYFLLAMKDGKYTSSPLVDVPECEGGMYYENNITQKYMIEKDKLSLDVIVSRGSGHEELLESSARADALDHEVGRKVEGLSMAGASLIRHLVQTALGRDKVTKKDNSLKRVRFNIRNIRERGTDAAIHYANAYAELWHGESQCLEKAQLSLLKTDPTVSETPAETPFRKLTFPFPSLSPKDMPVDIQVRIRPASGMASMEVVPQNATFLHGRQVFVDYRSMRPCPLKELQVDARGWPPLEELPPHPAAYVWNPAKNILNNFEKSYSQNNSFLKLLNEMYDIIKSPKQYVFPVGGDVISLPVLSQNGLAGSQEGIEVITRFCEILQERTLNINRWAPGQKAGQIGWLITRTTWLYGATPSNITSRIIKEIAGAIVTTRTIEAGSRSLMDTRLLADLLDCLAKQVQIKKKLVIQNIRACRNILTLRQNGQDALNKKTAKILLEAILKEIDAFSMENNYKAKFFVSIKLLLYLLRYRKNNPDFLKVDSEETQRIKDNLEDYLIGMKGCLTPARFDKAKEIISGTIDYLNYAGKTDFLNTLTEYSGTDDNDDD